MKPQSSVFEVLNDVKKSYLSSRSGLWFPVLSNNKMMHLCSLLWKFEVLPPVSRSYFHTPLMSGLAM